MKKDFVHLHVHSEYSLLDGACRVKDLPKRAKELGQNAVAITDHGVMFGVLEFYKACQEEGIKPIIGCEVYSAKRSRFDKEKGIDQENAHLILLCENEEGYKNLIKLVSMGFTEGFYSKPRIDDDALEKHSKGLICLSACLAGKIPQFILNDEYENAKALALKYRDIFGEGRFYLELQDHGIADQKKVLPGLLRLSHETGIPLVATNDAHYLEKKDSYLHDVLMCIQMNKTVEDEDRFGFETQEFYLKSQGEMEELFGSVEGAISNTQKIADMCNLEFEFGKLHLPKFEVAGGDSLAELKRLCYEGFEERYGKNDEAEKRLLYELSVIEGMGYIDYFLIVHDFIRFARERGISVGPGRGSAAGSVASYCLHITDIDPIKYGLIFERFLNPERVSMPDIDIDFCYERRQEVIDYVVSKYGVDHVAQIITFGTMAARAAIRDVARALNVPYAQADATAKMVPFELGMTLSRALAASPPLRASYDSDPKLKDLIDTAMAAEGMPRHASTHAAGVVITEKPVDSYVPLAKNDEAVVTQFSMTELEELGLLKMDFLGLRTLTVINDAQNLVRKFKPDFDIEKVSLEEKKVYELISNAQTEGIFQLESAGMKNALEGIKPENFEDIIAVISLYRPGPMDSIPKYIEWKHNPSKVSYKHEKLRPILDVTYGCIIYQEQVMEIVRELAGFSLARADLVRRAMSKKKGDVMKQEMENFVHGIADEAGEIEVEGAVRRGVPAKIAYDIFGDMMDFAKYAFNKSHAAAYAMLAYRTAYLKYFYPKEFLAALLTSVLDSSKKVSEYIMESKALGIKVLPPDVNESDDGFSVSGSGIRFGMLAVKNVGRGFLRELKEERTRNGPFTDFFDFCERMEDKELNKRALESLIYAGCFDEFALKRSQLIVLYPKILENIQKSLKQNVEGQIDLFSSDETEKAQAGYDIPDIPELPQAELLRREREVMGIYISGHPLSEYQEFIKKHGARSSLDMSGDEDEAATVKDGEAVLYIGIISSKKLKSTRNNSMMAYVTVEDIYGDMEVIIFPKTLEKYESAIKEEMVVAVEGRLNVKEEEVPKIICDRIVPVEEFKPLGQKKPYNTVKDEPKKERKIYLRFESFNEELFEKVKGLLSFFPGKTAVYFYQNDTKELSLINKSFWINDDELLINELNEVLGEENVKFKE